MKRYREGKGPHGGVKLLSGKFVRNVDEWRTAAARPIPSIDMWSTHEPGIPFADAVWTLEEDAKQIATWREVDMPGFAKWLQERLYERHGAWQVAQGALALVKGQQEAGAAQAKKLKAKAKRDRKKTEAEDGRIRKAAQQIIAANGPLNNDDLAEFLEERGVGDRYDLAKKLPKLLKQSK